MRYPRSSVDVLAPRTPTDRQTLFDLISTGLAGAGVDSAASRRLALAAVDHLGGEGFRLLISGEGASAGTRALRSLAELVDFPYVEIDAGGLAETNWHGADIAWHLNRLHGALAQRFSLMEAPRIASRALIHVHHLERLRLPGSYAGSAVTADYRAGKQTSLLPLLEGTSIPVDQGGGKGFTWDGLTASVALSGTFEGLPPRPHVEDLRDWGLLPSLAAALIRFTQLHLDGPSLDQVVRSIQDAVRALQLRFIAYGYRLEVTPQVLRHVSDAVASGGHAVGVEMAVRWIAEACDRALIRLLSDGSPPYTTHIVAVDDLSLPAPPRGYWRE